MKKVIAAVAVLAALTAAALAKADKSCWTGSKEQSPAPNMIGWAPLVPVTAQTSGGATALVNVATYAYVNLLTKVTTSINGVTTTDYYTNYASGSIVSDWKGSITLPDQILCDKPGNYGMVQVWMYDPAQAFGGSTFSAYASAKIQGN